MKSMGRSGYFSADPTGKATANIISNTQPTAVNALRNIGTSFSSVFSEDGIAVSILNHKANKRNPSPTLDHPGRRFTQKDAEKKEWGRRRNPG
jgi:hypothetical protein